MSAPDQPEIPPDESPAPEKAITHDGDAPAGERTIAQAPGAEGTSEPAPAKADARLRAFVAVNLPVAVIRRVADEATALHRPVSEAGYKVTWVPAANMHVTLKFLGRIRAETVEAIHGALTRSCTGCAPFELEARGLGAFPSIAHPRVLWAGLSPQPALIALQQEVETEMADLGFAREERAFHAHLTLGRVVHGGAVGALSGLFQQRENLVFGAGRVTEVVLYESVLQARGAEYRPLARVPLGR